MIAPAQDAIMRTALARRAAGKGQIRSTESYAEGWNACIDWLLSRTHDAHLRRELTEART